MTSHSTNTEHMLAELCASFFSIVLWLRTQSDLGAPENLRQKILGLFAKMESEGAKRGILQEDLHEAKFALTALLDETIMSSSWPGKSSWEKRMLQDELFNTTNAGEEFFTKLEHLRSAERKKPELLKVFYWCLLLGFEGKYDHRQALDLLINELKQELGWAALSLRQELSPGWKLQERAGTVRKRSWLPTGLVCAASLAGILIYFLILENRLSTHAETVKTNLEQKLKTP